MPNALNQVSTNANTLLVGDSGTHKSFFLGTCPKPYVFDFDAGNAIWKGRDVEYDIFKDIPPAPNYLNNRAPSEREKALGFYKFGEGWFGMVKKIQEIGALMDKGQWPYLTIGLDSLTMMSTLALNAALMQQDKKVIHQGTYGAQIEYMKTVLSQLTAWPIQVVATAHIHRDTNDLTQVTEKLPLLTGKLAGFVGAFFDEVYFCESEVKDGKQRFFMQSTATQSVKQAKSRNGVADGTETSYQACEPYYLGKKKYGDK